MRQFAVFQVPEAAPDTAEVMKLTEGTPLECVLFLLRQCSLEDLKKLELEYLRRVKWFVGKRTVLRKDAEVAAEMGRHPLLVPSVRLAEADDRSDVIDGLAPPESADMLADGDADEDGDAVMDPTPLEVINPINRE